jgi:hypothetical protein
MPSVRTNLDSGFYTSKNYKIRSINDRDISFFGIIAETQQSLYFFDNAQI